LASRTAAAPLPPLLWLTLVTHIHKKGRGVFVTKKLRVRRESHSDISQFSQILKVWHASSNHCI
jgi:hypothetical protein